MSAILLRPLQSLISVFVVLGLICASQTTWAAESIGKVYKQRHDVYGTLPEDDRERLFPRYKVYMGQLIETSGGSAVQMKLDDKTELYLGERAKLTLDEFVYDPDNVTSQRAVYNFTLGVMRFVSGQMNTSGVTINTPSVAIGLRGSDALIIVAPDGGTTVSVLDGVFSVMSITGGGDQAVDVPANRSVSVSVGGPVSDLQVGLSVPDYTPGEDEQVSDFGTDAIDLQQGGAFHDSSGRGGKVGGEAGEADSHPDDGDDHGDGGGGH
ncbi:FecR domain-containing protein [Magnetovibrio sp. PR-2]|uniref:FecR family protein n=1 Tax=Magnetovibrio sp. PR-2 TaxID=3120356 RepID=UPI002FCE1582